MKAKLLFVLATSVAGLLVPSLSTAHNFGGLFYTPGSACRVRSNSATNSIKYWNEGMAGNDDSTEGNDLAVTCPILRPADASGDADNLTLEAYYSDESVDDVLQCRAHACTQLIGSCINNGYESSPGTTSISNLTLASAWSIGSSRNLISAECIIPDNDGSQSKILSFSALYN